LIMEDEGRRGVAQGERTLRFQSVDQRREMRGAYDEFMLNRDGEKAVASSRSFYRLKDAQAPGEAIVAGSAEALRVAPTAPLAAPGRVNRTGPLSVTSPALESEARSYTQQGQFVGGKTFFQNADQWIDATVQKAPDAKRVRIQFGSTDYFELIKKQP